MFQLLRLRANSLDFIHISMTVIAPRPVIQTNLIYYCKYTVGKSVHFTNMLSSTVISYLEFLKARLG